MLSRLASEIVHAAVAAVNAIIAGFATAVQAVFNVLPAMPSLPDLPQPFLTAESWVAWFFPVSTVVDVLGFTLTVWLVWNVAAVALRWAKAIGD